MPLVRLKVNPPPMPTAINKPTFVVNTISTSEELAEFVGVAAEIGDTALTKTNKMFVFTSTGWKELLFDLEL